METPPVNPTSPEQVATPPARVNNVQGIVWILISVIGSSAMSVAVREVSLELDSRMIVMLRAVISALIILAALILISPLRRQMRFTRPWSHVIRGTLIAVSTHLGFYTLANIPLATATILFFTAPIFATLLAGPVHGEKVGPRRWAAVGFGFLGALIILRPGSGALHPAMLGALGSSALFAIALTLSRNLARADGPVATYFSSVVITVIITLPVIGPYYALPTTSGTWVAVAILVTMGALRGYADIQAYSYGEASVVAPFTYLRLVLVGLAGYLMFNELPDMPTLVGAAVIILATLYIARREALKKKPG